MANSEPHPLDPGSRLSDEERVLYAADPSDERHPWLKASRISTLVTNLHADGWEIRKREPLPDRAYTKRGHPRTSEIAAASIGDMKELHRAVLQVAETFADVFTYDELIHRYERRRDNVGTGFIWDLPQMSPSGIRSRCKALQRGGWIEQAGRALSDAGRTCNTWRVAR
jgi:hypothetical protein